MASPPEILTLRLPGIDSRRALSPSLATVALTAASRAPVTVLSTLTTIWLAAGSTANAVPGVFRPAVRLSFAAAISVPVWATKRGVAPAAVTARAVAASVTLTTTLPAASMYEPAVRLPNWLSSFEARAEGANEGSPAEGAAAAGDATNAEPTSTQAARPTIGRRSFRVSTLFLPGGEGRTVLSQYRHFSI